MEKILLDTDIGSDIDDALCLAYLLANPACNLLGITTVTGESAKRAMLADVLCKHAKKNIPIFPGTENSLIIPQKQPVAQQAVKLADWPHEVNFPKGQAVDFLRETIHTNPGEITLLTIGPLTNIALLFKIDPEIPLLLKKIVMMSGVFKIQQPYCEWNVTCDPHAAAIVYGAPVKKSISIGLDVTLQCTMNIEEIKKRFNIPFLKPVFDLAKVWFENTDKITFHDPLAAVTVFHNDVCSFEKGTVEIELMNEKIIGKTLFNKDSNNLKHKIAINVDVKNFFLYYFSVFNS
jgi:inosine-uridine nucleoside N-ribohydrolase